MAIDRQIATWQNTVSLEESDDSCRHRVPASFESNVAHEPLLPSRCGDVSRDGVDKDEIASQTNEPCNNATMALQQLDQAKFDQESTVAASPSMASLSSEMSPILFDLEPAWINRLSRIMQYRAHAQRPFKHDHVVKCFSRPHTDVSNAEVVTCFTPASVETFAVPHGVCQGAWIRDALARKIDQPLPSIALHRLSLLDDEGQLLWQENSEEDYSDVHMLACFLELSEVTDVCESSAKLLFRSIRLLRLCNYSSEEMCSILAHASVYFLDYRKSKSDLATEREDCHILVTFMYIAHCYVLDNSCPLRYWHAQLFRKYCRLKLLDTAVMHLLRLRDFVLRPPEEDLAKRYLLLIHSAWTLVSGDRFA